MRFYFPALLQNAEALKDNHAVALLNVERHPCSSFVDSVMVALTKDKEEDAEKEWPPGAAGTAASTFFHLNEPLSKLLDVFFNDIQKGSVFLISRCWLCIKAEWL